MEEKEKFINNIVACIWFILIHIALVLWKFPGGFEDATYYDLLAVPIILLGFIGFVIVVSIFYLIYLAPGNLWRKFNRRK